MLTIRNFILPWLAAVLPCLAQSIVYAAPLEIHVHYAFQDPKEDSASPLNLVLNEASEVGKSRIEFRAFSERNGYIYKEFLVSTTSKINESLKNPNVLGVIWVGHTLVDRQCLNCDDSGRPPKVGQKTVYKNFNGHLRSATGEYLPRHIFTARSASLKWLAVVGCNLGEIWPKYILDPNNSTNPVDVFLPHGNLGEISLITGLPDAFADAQLWLSKYRPAALTSPEIEPTSRTLKVRYRDLYSMQYTYEVLVNGVFVGELHSLISGAGLRKRSAITEIQIPLSLLSGPTVITILPNDLHRTNPYTNYPIDNVLIDAISLNGISLLDTSINIGDDDGDDLKAERDTQVALYSKENLPDLQRLKPVKELNIEVRP